MPQGETTRIVERRAFWVAVMFGIILAVFALVTFVEATGTNLSPGAIWTGNASGIAQETFFDCSANTNGGALTATGGAITCSDDDGGAGGSGDAVTVNSTAIDTTANLLDGDIDWTVIDGGAGGPDDITATVGTDGVGELLDIAAALKSGADATLITGTAGVAGNCGEWDANGDLIDSGGACGGAGAETNNLEADDPPTIADTEIYVGNGVGSGTFVVVSGDATLTNAGVLEVTEADALESNPADCGANTFATTIAANGDLTCASVDVSDDTNLTAGAYLTLTGDDVALDAEISATFGSLAIPSPSDTFDAFYQLKVSHAVTLSEVSCSTDVGTVTIQFDERVETTPNVAGTDVLTAPLVCDSDEQSTAAFSNAGIAANALLSLDIDAVATSPGVLRLHVFATKDD